MARLKPRNALVVRTFSYPTDIEGSGPDDQGVRPLRDVLVTVTRTGGGPVPGAQRTDADGYARFENLGEASDYRVTATATGFRVPTVQFVNGQSQRRPRSVDVKEGGEVALQLVLIPSPGTVTGTVQVVDANGVPIPGIPVNNLQIEAYNGDLLVDSGITNNAGQYNLNDIDRPGLIEIRATTPIAHAGNTYRPRPGESSQFTLVRPGTAAQVDIEYVATGAEIQVGAQIITDVNGQPERRPFDGVAFQLFQPGQARPLRELTTQPHTANVFPDLQAGAYRIVVVAPPASNGQRLQLTRPPTPELSLRLADGQRIDLSQEFEFEPTRGSALGSVVVAQDDTPLSGVAVVLSSQQQPQVVRRVVTNQNGEYEIDDLLPGGYRVELEQRVLTALGRRWELAPLTGQSDLSRTVEVRARATTIVPEFRLIEEEHLITGQVFRPSGEPAQFVVVQIFPDADPNSPVIDNVLTDRDGFYQFRAQSAGTFFLRVHEQNGFAQQLIPVTVSSPITAPPLFTSSGFPGAQGGTTIPVSPAPSDTNDFPFLTEEVDFGDLGTPARGAGTGVGLVVGRTVEREIREVLGWRPRTSDPKGFLAALQQAFTVTEVAGHTEVAWKPRSYSVDIQADLGAITGAQASLSTRAKGSLDQVLPLLDGLMPLRVDVDTENVDAIRAIVRSQLTELVTELGVEGGPRVQRVDQIFVFLLGDPPTDLNGRPARGIQRDPEEVDGSLAVLRDRLGLDRDRINTIDEEQNFTNFLVVLDHVVGLAESWDAQREFFVRGSTVEPFLGTQLVLLSRDLEVVAESVHEVEYAMNSVFLGAAERQTLELQFPNNPNHPLVSGSPPMFVSELLGWVTRFATEEGRQLIDEGGRQGVVAFRPTIQLLQALVEASRVAPAGLQDPNRMPAAYRRQRVQRALQELSAQLRAADARVEQIRPPRENDQVQLLANAPIQEPASTLQPRLRRQSPIPAMSNGDFGGVIT